LSRRTLFGRSANWIARGSAALWYVWFVRRWAQEAYGYCRPASFARAAAARSMRAVYSDLLMLTPDVHIALNART
jgi:hypothetical protein